MLDLFGGKVRPIYTICDITEIDQIKRFDFPTLIGCLYCRVSTVSHFSNRTRNKHSKNGYY